MALQEVIGFASDRESVAKLVFEHRNPDLSWDAQWTSAMRQSAYGYADAIVTSDWFVGVRAEALDRAALRFDEIASRHRKEAERYIPGEVRSHHLREAVIADEHAEAIRTSGNRTIELCRSPETSETCGCGPKCEWLEHDAECEAGSTGSPGVFGPCQCAERLSSDAGSES